MPRTVPVQARDSLTPGGCSACPRISSRPSEGISLRFLSVQTQTPSSGLTSAEAARRLEQQGPPARRHSSRSYRSIIRANALNVPNVILVVFGVLTIVFDSWRDALFFGIVIANIAIGSFQEIRSKRELDRLAALVAPEAVVVRDGRDVKMPVDHVVVGDLVRLSAGDQVIADGTVASADGLALDEANLTGESALVLRGPEASKRAFDTYRAARREAGLPAPGTDRFAYAALCYVGDTDEEGLRVGAKTLWFLNTSLKQAPQFSRLMPGRQPPEVTAQNYRTQPRPGAQAARRPADSLIGINAEQAIARGILCAGNPDTVYKQIMDIYDKVGGFGHFIFIGRSGFLDHQEAEKGIRLLAKEVLPRLPAATSTL